MMFKITSISNVNTNLKIKTGYSSLSSPSYFFVEFEWDYFMTSTKSALVSCTQICIYSLLDISNKKMFRYELLKVEPFLKTKFYTNLTKKNLFPFRHSLNVYFCFDMG